MEKNIEPVTTTERVGEADMLALLAATGRGDQSAFHRLYLAKYQSVFGFCLRLMSRHDRAEEVANDTMLAIWRSADTFEGRSKVSTWIFGIAYRIAMKAHKRDRPEKLKVDIDDAHDLSDQTALSASAMIDANAVNRAMATLPSELRAIMSMTYQYGFTIAEISQVTGYAEGTIKTRMSAARREMRGLLTEGTTD